jgi:hypothetical protein
MKKFALLLLLATQALAGSPILWGPNSQAVNLQNQIIHTTGALSQNDGQKNYIAYGNFENAATTGWSLGHVTLTSGLPTGVPTFGSGASAQLSLSTTGVTGLASRSLVYSTSTATVAGDFVASQAYTINNEDQAKVLQIKFTYEVFSGVSNAATNFNLSGTSSNSFGVAIYDVTNSAWIIPAGVWNVVQGTGAGTYLGTFQTPISMTQFRLVFFNANATTGTGSTVWLDSFFTGPQITTMGPAVSDWTSYTPTFTGFGTVSGTAVQYRRVGDTLEVKGSVTTGTVTGTQAQMTLPSGLSTDTTKIGTGFLIGKAAQATSSATLFSFGVLSSASTYITWGQQGSTSSELTAGNGNAVFASATNLSFFFSLPVSGWSSNTVMSNDTDTRIVTAQVSLASNVAPGTNAILKFDTVTNDTHAAYSTSTGFYTVPVPGYYQVQFTTRLTSSAMTPYLAKNGTAFQSMLAATTNTASSTTTVKCNAGDTLGIYANSTPTFEGGASPPTTFASFTRVSGPAVVAAAESVNFRYYASSTSLSGSLATINWTTKDYDSHNGMSSGTYTVPTPGKYHCNSQIKPAATFALNNTVIIELQKNGTVVTRNTVYAAAAVTDLNASISDDVSAVTGDTLRIQVSTSGTSPSVSASNFENYFSCARVGN